MSGLLPSTPDVSVDRDPEPRVIGLDSDDASDMLAALSSETARTVLSKLHEDPATPSALADEVDTSLQNVQYHLEKLERADLVEEVGTQYSEKGREMTLYGPADGPLVVFPGSNEEASGFKQMLRRALGAVLLLGAVSAVIEAIARQWLPWLGSDPAGGDDGGGVDGGDDTDVGDGTDDGPTEDQDTADSPDGDATGSDDSSGFEEDADVVDDPGIDPHAAVDEPHWLVEIIVEMPPGLLFFLGGCLVLLVILGLWYWRR